MSKRKGKKKPYGWEELRKRGEEQIARACGVPIGLATSTGVGHPTAFPPPVEAWKGIDNSGVSWASVKEAGDSLLQELRTNFATLDEVERATDPRRLELADWWRQTAENEIEQTVDKAVEYGATDLIDIGRTLGRVAGRELDDPTAAEWGVFFYLEGKLSRWRSAIERGDLPSFDCLLDIGVYARMAQRIRQCGSWPGVDLHNTTR